MSGKLRRGSGYAVLAFSGILGLGIAIEEGIQAYRADHPQDKKEYMAYTAAGLALALGTFIGFAATGEIQVGEDQINREKLGARPAASGTTRSPEN